MGRQGSFQGNQGSPGLPGGSRQQPSFAAGSLSLSHSHKYCHHLIRLHGDYTYIHRTKRFFPTFLFCFFQLCQRLWENFPESFCSVRAILITNLCGSKMGQPSSGSLGSQIRQPSLHQLRPSRLSSCLVAIHVCVVTVMPQILHDFFLHKAQSVSWLLPNSSEDTTLPTC